MFYFSLYYFSLVTTLYIVGTQIYSLNEDLASWSNSSGHAAFSLFFSPRLCFSARGLINTHTPSQDFFFLLFFFSSAPVAYGDSQARGWIGAAAAGLHHSHSNAGSLTHWARPGIEPTSSWMIVRFSSPEPQQELQICFLNNLYIYSFSQRRKRSVHLNSLLKEMLLKQMQIKLDGDPSLSWLSLLHGVKLLIAHLP